jgi:hypothetical protein
MFSDLVGSTALSVSMDPEDLREVQRTVISRGTASARRRCGLAHGAAWDHVPMHMMPHTVCMG